MTLRERFEAYDRRRTRVESVLFDLLSVKLAKHLKPSQVDDAFKQAERIENVAWEIDRVPGLRKDEWSYKFGVMPGASFEAAMGAAHWLHHLSGGCRVTVRFNGLLCIIDKG